MKQISLMVVASCLLLLRTAHAQSGDQKVTIGFPEMKLSQALEQLQQQSGVLFIYRIELLRPFRIKALPIAQRTLTATLDLLLAGTPLTYYLTHHHVVIAAQEKPAAPALLSIAGTVKDSLGNALPGASVAIIGSRIHTTTNEQGVFTLSGVPPGSIVQIRFVGYTDYVSAPVYTTSLSLVLREAARQLDSLQIQTGFQSLHPERVTGSYYVIGQTLLNQRVATNLLDKLDGVTSGMLLTRNTPVGSQANESRFSIRGRSTINSDPDPLVVVDNFPYDGSLDNINPADIASVTILKDAAAASIWGALSGNGVMVITTKTGQYNKKPEVHLLSNFTVGSKPDLYYTPRLNTADYLSVESYLFQKGYYDYTANDYSVLSPGVDILVRRARNQISSADSLRLMQSLSQQDVRRELSTYYYRPSFNQQYALNVSGGGPYNKYYFSVGADRNSFSLRRNTLDRITVSANNTYSLLNKRLEFSNSLFFSRSITANNAEGALPIWPYVQLADATGAALPVPYNFRKSYTDTAGGGSLLDWDYRPLDELNNSNHIIYLNEYRVSAQLRYRVAEGLHANLQYQLGYGNEDDENYYSSQMYYTRNLINAYTQINTAGQVYRPIPLGGIQDVFNSHYLSQNLRSMVQYTTHLHQRDELSLLAGYDVRRLDARRRTSRQYGYDKAAESGIPIDFATLFPDYTKGGTSRIPANVTNLRTSNNFLSWYVNGNYTYKEKYSATLTLRRDASNLYGVTTNQQGVPLWAAGVAWAIRKTLKWRASYGLTGNSNNTISAYTTAARGTTANRFNEIISTISNPANASLRWEQVAIYNTGIDVSTANRRISGSLDYYVKKGKDLIAPGPVDPSTGVSVYTGNAADMRAWGMDLVVNSVVLDKPIRWTNTLLFSINRDKVVYYKIRKSVIGDYMNNGLLNPQEGYPLYALYSFPYLGLNKTGDPISMLDGRPSTAYNAITSSTNFNNLIFHGSATPTLSGSLRNSIGWKEYFLNILITMKGGYYFRRTSINYFALATGQSLGHPDWKRRWQHPGDEAITNIPAMVYPVDQQRDDIYTNSNALVEKGDHIRLQDIQLGCTLQRTKHHWLPFASATAFVYVNNLGILWRANKHGIDPDYYPYATERVLPPSRTYSMGFQFDF